MSLEVTTKTAEEMAKEINQAIETKATKEEVKAIENQMKAFSDGIETLSTKFQELAESTKAMQEVDVYAEVEKFIAENHSAIKQAFKSGAGTMEIKAPALVTTANGTLPTALPVNYVAETQGVGTIPLRRASLLDYVRTFNTNQKTLAYVEAEPKDGDFAVVAEGGEKPQLDITWATRWAQPIKFAGWMKVTEEVIEDIPQLRDLIVNYLRGKHDLKKEEEVFDAIDNIATAYITGGDLAGSTIMPNIQDVVLAMQTQVLMSPNYTDEPDFIANTVLINPIDFVKEFGMAKDDNGRPLYTISGVGTQVYNINGITYVITRRVAVGDLIVMDGSKVNVTTYSAYRTEIGWVNDDFIKNLFVILGESRGHIFIRKHDERAFVKASIADVKADLENSAPSV